MLTIDSLKVSYGDAPAISEVSLKIEAGSIVTLIGANGAGKSTTLNAVAGLVRFNGGGVNFMDHDLSLLSAQDIVSLGISLVPEGRRLFSKMTVLENLEMGAYIPAARQRLQDSLSRVLDLFEPLKGRLHHPAGVLSGGQQQMLAIGRALMAKPRLLLLDEPSMGLSPVMVQEIARIILAISRRGVPVVLVEQNAELALRLADYAYVLETGTVALEGPADTLHDNPHVQSAYLGG